MRGRRFRIFSLAVQEDGGVRDPGGREDSHDRGGAAGATAVAVHLARLLRAGRGRRVGPRGRPLKEVAAARRRALLREPSPQARKYRHAGREARDSRLVELERKVGQQAVELDFFKAALRHVKAPPRPSGGRGGRASCALTHAMMPPQGALGIERMCALTSVSRASYYRYWRRVAPGREQIELRDVLQRLALGHRHYGYRRLTALLRRDGWAGEP